MKGVTYTTTKQLLINTPVPTQTRTYKPVEHERLIDLTLEGIHQAGFTLDKELYSSAKDGQVATGRYSISSVSDNEMNLQIMWQNSYNKVLKLEFLIGAIVLVCENGMVSFRSMDSFRKKHMGEIQTLAPQRIGEYIKNAGDIFMSLQGERDKMKQVQVDRRVTAELLGRIYFEEEFIEATQLNIIKRELDNPTHNYNAPGSLWELYNHTTFAIGGIHPGRWLNDHMAAHKFFSEASDMLTTIHVQAEPENVFPIPLALRDTMSPIEDPRVKQLSLYD
jgi:hypothetical protein